MRRKWVRGKAFADDLGPARHAAKRKHESGEQNRREKDEESHLYRLQLFLAMVEKVIPIARFAMMNTSATSSRRRILPCIGT